MKFEEFHTRLTNALQHPLPGERAQYILAPMQRQRPAQMDQTIAQARQAAVLALFENYRDETSLILTRRTKYGGVHSGQISFPGGKREREDHNFLDTALRETTEEIGVPRSIPRVITALTKLYIPPSNFIVYPYLALAEKPIVMKAQESEVQKIHRIPLAKLMDKGALRDTPVHLNTGVKVQVPAFVIDDLVIWGATAMILSEILALLEAPSVRHGL